MSDCSCVQFAFAVFNQLSICCNFQEIKPFSSSTAGFFNVTALSSRLKSLDFRKKGNSGNGMGRPPGDGWPRLVRWFGTLSKSF